MKKALAVSVAIVLCLSLGCQTVTDPSTGAVVVTTDMVATAQIAALAIATSAQMAQVAFDIWDKAQLANAERDEAKYQADRARRLQQMADLQNAVTAAIGLIEQLKAKLPSTPAAATVPR